MNKGTYKIQDRAAEDGISEEEGYLFDLIIWDKSIYFGVCKKSNGWTVSEISTGRLVHINTTRSKAVIGAHKRVEEAGEKTFLELVRDNSLSDWPAKFKAMGEAKKMQTTKMDKLNKLLPFPVPIDGMMSSLSGKRVIDIVKLDHLSQCPDGVSLNQHLVKTYGQEVSDLVEALV